MYSLPIIFVFVGKSLNKSMMQAQPELLKLACTMHLALSTMHLTLLSANITALLEAISMISFSPIFATVLGSNSAKASLC